MDDYSKFEKAYEELEKHTQMLFEMTNAHPETTKEKYLTRREKSVQIKPSGPDSPGLHPNEQSKMITKNNELAGNFLE